MTWLTPKTINTQLKDYVKVYKGFLDKDFCNLIVSNFVNNTWEKHFFEVGDNLNKDEFITYTTDFLISNDNFSGKTELVQKIWDVLYQYVLKDMAYMDKWFGGWTGFSYPRINKYEAGTEMRIHWDRITTIFDGQKRGIPSLTVLGALNNDYEGGELILCGEPLEFRAGDVLVFPSTFLYPHSVNTVKSGTRYSFVSWAW